MLAIYDKSEIWVTPFQYTVIMAIYKTVCIRLVNCKNVLDSDWSKTHSAHLSTNSRPELSKRFSNRPQRIFRWRCICRPICCRRSAGAMHMRAGQVLMNRVQNKIQIAIFHETAVCAVFRLALVRMLLVLVVFFFKDLFQFKLMGPRAMQLYNSKPAWCQSWVVWLSSLHDLCRCRIDWTRFMVCSKLLYPTVWSLDFLDMIVPH